MSGKLQTVPVSVRSAGGGDGQYIYIAHIGGNVKLGIVPRCNIGCGHHQWSVHECTHPLRGERGVGLACSGGSQVHLVGAPVDMLAVRH